MTTSFPARSLLLVCAAAAMALWAPPGLHAEKLQAFVSIPPQKQIVQRVAGDRVQVHVILPRAASPAAYEPKPRQMAALEKASLYFAIGVPFEKAWLPRFREINPDMAVVRLDQAVRKRPMVRALDPDAAQASERAAGGVREALDPHVWLSPPLVRVMAQRVRDALITADPGGEDGYHARFSGFARDVDVLDRRILDLFEGCRRRRFMVFHPSWGYFSRAYGLRMLPVELEGKQPGPQELSKLIELAKKRSIRSIFVQPQFSTKSARVIANAVDGEVVTLDPLAEDWLANLKATARKLSRTICSGKGK
jgi:zinc transport system substrate-binding protein